MTLRLFGAAQGLIRDDAQPRKLSAARDIGSGQGLHSTMTRASFRRHLGRPKAIILTARRTQSRQPISWTTERRFF